MYFAYANSCLTSNLLQAQTAIYALLSLKQDIQILHFQCYFAHKLLTHNDSKSPDCYIAIVYMYGRHAHT